MTGAASRAASTGRAAAEEGKKKEKRQGTPNSEIKNEGKELNVSAKINKSHNEQQTKNMIPGRRKRKLDRTMIPKNVQRSALISYFDL